MGSLQMPLSVPTINLAGVVEDSFSSSTLNLNSKALDKVVKEIRDACAQWGFFYVVGHGVSPKLVQEIKSVAGDFFHKPKDYKKTIYRQLDNYRGFHDNELTKQKQDWKEAFDFGMENVNGGGKDKRIDSDPGMNQWPAHMPHFRNKLLEYFTSMHSLGATLMDLIFMSLDVDPASMKHHFNLQNDTSWCRLNYYPINPTGVKHLGVGPHSDPGVLTVLLQDDGLSSLQVERDGEYYDVPPVPDSYVINIGDMMQVWSNGKYKAPVHRVLSHPTKERFSCPFFYGPSYDTDVQPVPQSVTNDKPVLYRPVNWGIFLNQRFLGNYADYGEEIQIHHFEIKSY